MNYDILHPAVLVNTYLQAATVRIGSAGKHLLAGEVHEILPELDEAKKLIVEAYRIGPDLNLDLEKLCTPLFRSQAF